ncbi:MAG: leucine-rich repeat domain-containing protein, partial [Ruminococcus sp.]|nr:leucine-rich repeat domain-containing protein [Ruminococcus sp.]
MKRKKAVYRAVGWITALCVTNSLLYAPVCDLQAKAVINNVPVIVRNAIKNSDENSEVTTVSTEDGFEFEVYSDHAVLAKYSGDATEVVIPDTVSGVPVTTIGYSAFFKCTSLTSVDIPDSVTTIKWNVFEYCNNLKEINVSPDNNT